MYALYESSVKTALVRLDAYGPETSIDRIDEPFQHMKTTTTINHTTLKIIHLYTSKLILGCWFGENF